VASVQSRPAQPRPVPTRTCVACRTARPKRDLVRIVRTPAGQVVEDPTGRLAGRGAYVCPDGACRELALAKGGLARAFGRPISAAERSELTIRAGDQPVDPALNDEGDDRGQE